jgi:hypothetical protein
MSRMIDRAEQAAIRAYLPNLPENSGSFGTYFYRDQETPVPDLQK